MARKVTPFLWYDDQAEEAANFYVSIFKDGEILSVNRSDEGKAFVVSFRLGTQSFLALNGGPEHRFTDAISFMIDCADQGEIDHFWEKLSDGGEPGRCGWLKDKYGLSWQVVPTALGELMGGEPERAGRAMQALMSMSKLDIAALQRAYDGNG